ncbi:MAG TPA: hypothetical protein VEY91_11245 [Candidatus Limnocylindria bacterium]|nr:hypothetical protein [Candidatus Limnocylindria bacterium]
MNRKLWVAVLVVVASCSALGCGGTDLPNEMMSNPEMQAAVFDRIATDRELAGRMVDKLMATDSTRTWVMDRLMTGEGAQALMVRAARDRTMLDGILNLAVQDSSTRDHVMTLFRGMQMASPQ